MTYYLPEAIMRFVDKYAREWLLALSAGAIIFCGISLYYYDPYDPSYFFHTTRNLSVQNLAGSFGAIVAAFLFYIFGQAAWGLLLFGVFLTAIFYTNQESISKEWDRTFFFIIGITASSMLFYYYKVGYYSGGSLGFLLYEKFILIVDPIIAISFLWLSIFFSIIIILRNPIIAAIFVGIRLYHWLQKTIPEKRWLWEPMFFLCYTILLYACMPFYYFYQWLKKRIMIVCNENPEDLSDQKAFFKDGIYSQESDSYAQTYDESNSQDVVQELLHKNALHEDALHENIENLDREDKDIAYRESTGKMFDEDESLQLERAVEKVPQKKYRLPSIEIFNHYSDRIENQEQMQVLEAQARVLEEKLERFGVAGSVVSIKHGPVVTLFEYRPHIDSKISKIIALEDDLALALQALSIRIIAPIPGRSVVGFEVANSNRNEVLLSSVVRSPIFQQYKALLPIALGKDTVGGIVCVDLARMPHLLVAGSTGSGKSVALNSMLVSLLCKLSPDELRLILIDPKRLEFASYADIAHLLFPIITNPKKAAPILRWVVRTMEERYELMASAGARSIDDYNNIMNDSQNLGKKIPYILVIIDELSDLMMTAGKEIEDLIARITQMARAAGIHMIVATQRPSVDVITGLIKVNFPSRISFRVTSKIDSRTILDCSGAEKLLGRGDMLFLDSGQSALRRIHGVYVSDKEISDLVSYIKKERAVEYLIIEKELPSKEDMLPEADDELYKEVIIFLEAIDEISISLLQRKFRIGYNRSARIIEKLEAEGYIEPSSGSKTRTVIK